VGGEEVLCLIDFLSGGCFGRWNDGSGDGYERTTATVPYYDDTNGISLGSFGVFLRSEG
jgi:hypothetical protein